MERSKRQPGGSESAAESKTAQAAADLAGSMFFKEIGQAIELNMGGPGQRLSASRQYSSGQQGSQRYFTIDGQEITSKLEFVRQHVIRFDYSDQSGGPVRVSIYENGRAAALRNDPPAVMIISWGEDEKGRPVETTELHIRSGTGQSVTYSAHPEATRTVTQLEAGELSFSMRTGGVEQAVTIAPDGLGRTIELTFSQMQVLQFGAGPVSAGAICIELDGRETVSRVLVRDATKDAALWSPVADPAFCQSMQQAARQTLTELRRYHGYPEPIFDQDRAIPAKAVSHIDAAVSQIESPGDAPVEQDAPPDAGLDPWIEALESLNSQTEVPPAAGDRASFADEAAAVRRQLSAEDHAELSRAIDCLGEYSRIQLRYSLEQLLAYGLKGCAESLLEQFRRLNPHDALFNLSSSSRILPRLVETGLLAEEFNRLEPQSLNALRVELASLPDEAFDRLCDGIGRLSLSENRGLARHFAARFKDPQFSCRLSDLAMGGSAGLPTVEQLAADLHTLLSEAPTLDAPKRVYKVKKGSWHH